MFRQLVQVLLGTSDPGPDVTTQRRKTVRVPCRLPIECLSRSRRIYGELLDIGEGGLRIELPEKVRPNYEVEIRYLGNLGGTYVDRSITVRVVWMERVSSAFHVGVAFVDGPSALAASWVSVVLRRLFRAARMSDDRQHMRCPTDVEAGLRIVLLEVSKFQRGRLLDLSVGGALYQGPLLAPVSTPVDLLLLPRPGISLILAGRVVRRPGPTVNPYLLGIRFEPMTAGDREELEAMLKQQVRRWRDMHGRQV